MICVEGPNAAGKSTLCKKFAAAWDMKVHYGRALETPEELWRTSLEVATIRGSTVLDRCFISELIYNNPCGFTFEQLYLLALQFNTNCELMIFLLPPWEVIKSRYLYDGHPMRPATVDDLRNVYDRYGLLRAGLLRVTTADGVVVSAVDLLPDHHYWRSEPVEPDAELRDAYTERMARRVEYHARWSGVGTLDPGGIVVMIEGRTPPLGVLMGMHYSQLGLNRFHVTGDPGCIPYLNPRLVVGSDPGRSGLAMRLPTGENDARPWGKAVAHAYRKTL